MVLYIFGIHRDKREENDLFFVASVVPPVGINWQNRNKYCKLTQGEAVSATLYISVYYRIIKLLN